MGLLSLRRLLRSRLGVVDLPGHARTLLPVSVCMATGKLLAQARLDSLRRALRRGRAHRTGRDGRPSAAWHLDSLPALPARAPVESPDDRRGLRRHSPCCRRGSCATTCSSTNSFRCAAATDSNSTSATTATTQHWVNRALHPNHSDAELSEYERVGEVAYMDHKLQQAKDYIRSHPAWFAWMTFRRIVYMWTGYWSFDRAYLKDEPLDPPNIFVNTTMSILGLWGLSARLAARSRAGGALCHRASLLSADLLLLASRDLLLSSRSIRSSWFWRR